MRTSWKFLILIIAALALLLAMPALADTGKKAQDQQAAAMTKMETAKTPATILAGAVVYRAAVPEEVLGKAIKVQSIVKAPDLESLALAQMRQQQDYAAANVYPNTKKA